MDFEILFVDDDKDILFIVQKYLSGQGYNVTVADNGIEALGIVKQKNFDIVFTDFRMPDIDGLELLTAIKEYRPETEVVIVTGYGTMESAIKAMKYGGYDYIQKPFKLDSLKLLIDRVVEEKRLRDENIILRRRIKDGQRHRYHDLVGMSLRMQDVYETIERVGPSDLFVLIMGESGTGKELAARTIHQQSERSLGPFVPVNCGSIRQGIPESRLFDQWLGLLDGGSGGTVYLDEITEVPPVLQGRIMEILKGGQTGGSDKTVPQIDVRMIAATKMDPDEAVAHGGLQQEFLRMFNSVILRMPPLRERKEDICLLINHFLYSFNLKNSKKIGCLSPEALDMLLDYHWPGNVIQLGNVIERAFAMGVEGVIQPADLPPEVRTFVSASRKNDSAE